MQKKIDIFIIKYLTLATFRTSHQNYSQRDESPKERDLVKKSLCWQQCFCKWKIPVNVLMWSRLVSMITFVIRDSIVTIIARCSETYLNSGIGVVTFVSIS